jgi:leader peptidase (prepilin peptidase)/N-methyltransferase
MTMDFSPIPVNFLVLLLTAAVGLVVGSFLNVVIHRLPRQLQEEWDAMHNDYQKDACHRPAHASNLLLKPRSFCPHCRQKIAWYHNVPVISYLYLRGKCAYCFHHIHWRYPFVELLSSALAVAVVIRWDLSYTALMVALLVWSLIALSFIDLETFLLPDVITLPLLWLGLLLNTQNTLTSLSSAVWGAALGYATLWLVYWAFKLIRQKEGMGYGDFKLMAAIGAWCGAQTLPWILLLASSTGAICSLLYLLWKKADKNQALPFGPYLALATLWVLLLPQNLQMGLSI